LEYSTKIWADASSMTTTKKQNLCFDLIKIAALISFKFAHPTLLDAKE
jgi:hypothetical protein